MQEMILAFWFGPEPGVERPEWFRKDDAFDATIRARFGTVIETTLAGGHEDWADTARGSLARVIVLDQFTRNVFRGTPLAFAGDAQALATSRNGIARGFDRDLTPLERWFLYMPFQHAEDVMTQRESLRVFSGLAEETGLAGPLEWARRHAAIVERFGRYPHRNAILNRTSTPEEEAFLREPGSRF